MAVAGAAIITVTRPRDLGHWRSWALLLPLCSALIRGVAPPIGQARAHGLAKRALGLPDRLHHVLAGGADGAARPQGQLCRAGAARGPVLVRDDRDQQRLSALTLFAAVRNGPITLVAPLAAIYPLVTVALSAMVLKHHRDHRARSSAGAALTVLGVVLVLIG